MHSGDVDASRHFTLSPLPYLVDWTLGLLMSRDDQTP